MVKEAELSRHLGHLSQAAVGRLTRCLAAYGLPVTLDDKRIQTLSGGKYVSTDAVLNVMKLDKKNAGSKKKVVLLSKIGGTLEQKASIVADDDIYKIMAPSAKVTANLPPEHAVTLSTPGSKSISNRALVLAALGNGTCRISNLLSSDDTQVMLTALQQLGAATFEWEDNGETLVVLGSGGKHLRAPGTELYLGNAGTAARFLTTVCTLVPAAAAVPTVLTGNARMKQRPIGPLVDALRANGNVIKYIESEGCPPIALSPGGLAGGEIRLAASVSSQYVSSILLCAPYATKEHVTLVLTGGKVISQPYIDMTIAMMKTFGVIVERVPGENIYKIPQGAYHNPPAYKVESDASSSTYPLAIAAITGTKCTIDSIGADSLQGDARFAIDVLRPMGCKVEQTASTTTVTGPLPGKLRPLPSVDMEPMTDAFLTAAVLAAVANDGAGNVTRIHGIANQRVKECNRIEAMITELSKFGVHAIELDDGIEIHGLASPSLLKLPDATKGGVKCYDDHRVAMSFSVLACAVPGGGTVIAEKKCVEKTWPSWWDDLSSKLGVQVDGVDLGPAFAHSHAVANASTSRTRPSTTIVLIGMRGAGKSTMGRLAAQELGKEFVDMDTCLAEEMGGDITKFVADHGWPAFRDKEEKLLAKALAGQPTGQVIACGGGIVETPEARQTLKTFIKNGGIVISISRDFAEIERYLSGDGQHVHRPAWGEEIRAVWERRKPYFEECSNYEFVSLSDIRVVQHDAAVTNGNHPDAVATAVKDRIRQVEKDFVRLLHFLNGKDTNHVDTSAKRSYFLSLTYPDISQALPYLDAMTYGVDAIELRVDLLVKPPAMSEVTQRDYIAHQIAMLRRNSSLPIIFTVRTVSQGGRHDDSSTDEAVAFLRDAVKWGCEYVDIEIALPEEMIQSLVATKGNSLIITSWHDWSGSMAWNGQDLASRYKVAEKYGDIVKIIGKANRLEDNFAVRTFVEGHPSKPIIALNMGQQGQLSRILNPVLSPVSHPLQPIKAAPGQMSVVDIQRALHLIGEMPSKQFYLFGTPIQHSPSPTMHNAGFQTLGLPHHYGLNESKTIDDAKTKEILASPSFGGASVTIPHKLSIIKYIDELTDAATIIGAVNTIIPRNGRLVGDNTDWLGMRNTIMENVGTTASIQTGLVVGAGGTSRAAIYTLLQLGAKKIYLYNRTKENAVKLVSSMNVTGVEVVDVIHPDLKPDVIISTIPALGLSKSAVPPEVFAHGPGVAVEMAYKPRRTAFLETATQNGWAGIEGVQVLIAQGLEQFKAWTGMQPPASAIAKAVYAFYKE